MSAALTLWLGCLFLASCTVGLTLYGRWLLDRADARALAADDALIAEASDVLAQEEPLVEAAALSILDEVETVRLETNARLAAEA